MESEYWQTICQSWMAPQYCNYTGTFEFTAHIDLADTTQDNQCLHFKVSNATLDGSVHTPNCPSSENSILTVCDVYCDSYVLNDLIAVPELSDNDVYDLYQYWVFLFLMIFAWVFQAITTSTADAICFELLGMYIIYLKLVPKTLRIFQCNSSKDVFLIKPCLRHSIALLSESK